MDGNPIMRLPLARALTADKHVDSRLLNRLGIQLARQTAARGLLAVRCLVRRRSARLPGFRELVQNGLLVIPDFLPEDEFRQLRAECLRALDDPSVQKSDLFHGPTLVRRILVRKDQAAIPLASRISACDRIVDLLGAVEGKKIRPEQLHRAVERVIHGDRTLKDPENDLHIDTFHSTHKAWLYLNDVRMEDGPLAVVPRSHRLDLTLLRRTYRYFLGFKDGMTASRRIEEGEVRARGLQEVAMCVPANTLVIANTGGYHRRLRGPEGAVRDSIHVSARTQPFLFWIHAAGRSDY
jgi:hypothetical protein